MAIVHVAFKSSSQAPPAAAHAHYIAREGQYQQRGGVELVESGNMPEFARDDPHAFWIAADTHERANGRTYTEVQIALPRELNRGEREELARQATRELLGDRFAYTMAIHSPLAQDNLDQPHMHLMFSERAVTDATREMPEERFFKRNGAKKDPAWNDRNRPEEVREKWVEMRNGAMQRAGHEQRLDPRSWAEQGREDPAALVEPKFVLRQRLAQMEKRGLPKPATYTDVRKLLNDKSIDAISIATPNHWHSLMAIWACQAGKDVHVEKPCSHNLWEGKQLVRAAQRYNRIVQHGTQTRSSTTVREAVQAMRGGAIGEMYMARGLCYKWRDTIGKTAVQAVPQGVDYNLWTGPAPERPFTKNRFHYNWHWFWDYGNGDLGNQGVHQVDLARWGLGVGFPNKVSAIGGHFMFDDDQQTPNDLNCAFEFNLPNGERRMLTFEVRHWITNHEALIGTPRLGTPEPEKSSAVAFPVERPARGDEIRRALRAKSRFRRHGFPGWWRQ